MHSAQPDSPPCLTAHAGGLHNALRPNIHNSSKIESNRLRLLLLSIHFQPITLGPLLGPGSLATALSALVCILPLHMASVLPRTRMDDPEAEERQFLDEDEALRQGIALSLGRGITSPEIDETLGAIEVPARQGTDPAGPMDTAMPEPLNMSGQSSVSKPMHTLAASRLCYRTKTMTSVLLSPWPLGSNQPYRVLQTVPGLARLTHPVSIAPYQIMRMTLALPSPCLLDSNRPRSMSRA